jgi:hypothetical protein
MESERFKTTLTPEFIPVGYDYPGNLSSILARVKKLYTGAQCFSGSDRSLRALLVEDGVIVATGAELTENFDEQEIFNPDHYIRHLAMDIRIHFLLVANRKEHALPDFSQSKR